MSAIGADDGEYRGLRLAGSALRFAMVSTETSNQ
jgi:hypothetical protein